MVFVVMRTGAAPREGVEPVCNKAIKAVVLWDLVEGQSKRVDGLSIPPRGQLGSTMARGFGKLIGAVSSNLNVLLDRLEGGGQARYARAVQVIYKEGGESFKQLVGGRGPHMKRKPRVYEDLQWAGNLESLVQTGVYST
jgi:hypothetical protein